MLFSILRMYIKWQYRIGFSLKNPLGYYKLVTNIQNMYVFTNINCNIQSYVISGIKWQKLPSTKDTNQTIFHYCKVSLTPKYSKQIRGVYKTSIISKKSDFTNFFWIWYLSHHAQFFPARFIASNVMLKRPIFHVKEGRE